MTEIVIVEQGSGPTSPPTVSTPPAATSEPMDTGDKQGTPPSGAEDAANPTAEAKKEEEKKPEEKKTEEKKPEKTETRHILNVQAFAAGLTPDQLKQSAEAERKRIAQDIEVRDTAEKKNALESYVYDTRAALGDDLAPYISETTKEDFLRELNATEDWIFTEGESTKKEAYVARLADLKKVGDPVYKRKREAEDRPHAFNELKAAINYYTELANSTDPKYDHISEEDRNKIRQKCQEATDFVFPKVAQHDTLPKTTDPVILAADINQWKENLDKYCPPIMNKPKPAPPKRGEEGGEERGKEGGRNCNTDTACHPRREKRTSNRG